MTKRNRWLIATNTENLKNIIAQGLITEPSGFFKYYKDALEMFPGILMVFKNKIPQEIFDKSIEEDPSLDQCILELSFENITGSVECVIEDNKEEESGILFSFDFEKNGDKNIINNGGIQNNNIISIDDIPNASKAIYMELPLPLSTIKNVIFSSKKIKDKFLSEVAIIPNVPLVDFPLKTEAKLFNTSSKISLNKTVPLPKEIDYSLVYAYGGLLTMAFYYAKNGKLSNSIFHSMSILKEVNEKIDENIKWICDYFRLDADTNIFPLYKKLLDVIINNEDVKDEIVQTLKTYSEEKYKKRAQKLADILIEFVQDPQKSTSEYLGGAKKPLEKWILMLLFKERSDDLIEYSASNKVIDFTEEDYILFAMIFGIKDKFINLPKELREFQGLQKFISLKMASYAHKLRESKINISMNEKDVPLTLTDMFEKKEFKILFSKQHKIDCLSSELKLPKGSRTEHNKDSVVYFNGNLHDYIKLNIDDKKFYKTLFNKIIYKDDYKKYLTQYKRYQA